MSTNIPVLFNAGFTPESIWDGTGGKGYSNVMIDYASGSDTDASGSGAPLNFVAVFDRKNPNAKTGPVFTGAAPNSSTIPPGLDQYLTTDYIMFWSSAAFVTSMPQGALYDMLSENGGGGKLRQMETYATHMACGVNANMVYLLASIPSSGIGGVEFLEIRGTSTTGGSSAVLSYKNAPYNLLLELIPAPDGLYTPLEIG